MWIRTNLISCFRSDKDQHQQKYWQFPACDLNTTSTQTGTKAYWTTKMFLLILKNIIFCKFSCQQVLELLHGQNAGVGRLFIRAASSIIREMLAQYPELAQKYILSLMLEPLAKTTKEIEGTRTIVNCYLYDWNVVTAVEWWMMSSLN